MKDSVKRVVLAYSGGLDTSVILKWLQVTYNCEVVTFTADLGQGEELEPARAKAVLMGMPDEAHLYRRPARGIRARLRLPDDARQCPL
jgi:argininosuccinate synthase